MLPHEAHIRLPDKAFLCKRSLKKVCCLNPRLCSRLQQVFVRVNKHLVNEQDFPCTVFEAWIWGEAAVILLWQKIISWSLSWNDFALLNMIGSRWHGRLSHPIKRHVPPTCLETSVSPGRNELCVQSVKDGYCCHASDGWHYLPGSQTQACYVFSS